MSLKLCKFSGNYSNNNNPIAMVNEVASNKSFGGQQKVFEHDSEECKCRMKFGVYFPPQVCYVTYVNKFRVYEVMLVVVCYKINSFIVLSYFIHCLAVLVFKLDL